MNSVYCTLPVPQRGLKKRKVTFSYKSGIFWKKVCYKLYSRENFKQRSCKAFTGLSQSVLFSRFQSYLDCRTQFVRRGTASSTVTFLLCGSTGVGSWTHPVSAVYGGLAVVGRQIRCTLYADYTQIFGSCHPLAVSQLQERVSARVDEVALWMQCNRLQLHASKTEVLWCASRRRQHQIPRTTIYERISVQIQLFRSNGWRLTQISCKRGRPSTILLLLRKLG